MTPEQIKAHKFRSAGKGLYRSDDVDAFFQESVAAFVKTQEENAQLQSQASQLQTAYDELFQKTEKLADALSQMKGEREIIQKTLITAQQLADDMTDKARAEADTLVANARTQAEQTKAAAQQQVGDITLQAKAAAENALARARVQADDMVADAQVKVQVQQQLFNQARQEMATMRLRLLDLVEQIPQDDDVEFPSIELTVEDIVPAQPQYHEEEHAVAPAVEMAPDPFG
ncbi:MAG: DivIVA domain-containing protein [Oscillospiraceae bacterium]|nr:DivIVA domain-containing protein [Oscillospiraceae bacterium]